MVKHGEARQVTDDNIIWHMRLASWITSTCCFSTATMVHKCDLKLHYTYIAPLIFITYHICLQFISLRMTFSVVYESFILWGTQILYLSILLVCKVSSDQHSVISHSMKMPSLFLPVTLFCFVLIVFSVTL